MITVTSRRPRVVILDYGSGNLRSAQRAFERAGADVSVTADRDAALSCDGLVVPGVGAFASCMRGLHAVDGPRVIDRRLAGGRPVLGICVGMQVLFDRGVEGPAQTTGCQQWVGVVDRLTAPVIPHMGWNTVAVPKDSRLFAGVQTERFYFVHSYAARTFDADTAAPFVPPVVTWAEHGEPFVAAVENGALSGTQFHPEKSGRAGAILLANWLSTLSSV